MNWPSCSSICFEATLASVLWDPLTKYACSDEELLIDNQLNARALNFSVKNQASSRVLRDISMFFCDSGFLTRSDKCKIADFQSSSERVSERISERIIYGRV